MQVSATVRVRPDPADRDEPDRARLHEAARLLQQAGFEVLRIGRFGVSIRGEHRDFSRVLGVDAAPNVALSAPVDVQNPQLRDLVDLVEITSSPKSY
jgi:hypothetical protein